MSEKFQQQRNLRCFFGNEHRITIAEESVFIRHGVSIRAHDIVVT
jgi:hypothetical protein